MKKELNEKNIFRLGVYIGGLIGSFAGFFIDDWKGVVGFSILMILSYFYFPQSKQRSD